MPQVFATTGFAGIRARAKSREYDALAYGAESASKIIGAAIEQYSAQRRADENTKLQLMDRMVQMYGSQADQPMLEEYDKLLRRKGISLPRDSAGRAMPPPPTSEFQLFRDKFAKDPKALDDYLQTKLSGMSPIKQQFEKMKIDETQRYHDLLAHEKARMADAAMLRAVNTGNKGRAGASPSGLIRDRDGTLKYDQGQELEPGQVRLTVDAAKADYNKRSIEQLGEVRDMQNKIRKQDLRLKRINIGYELTLGTFRYLAPLLDKDTKGELAADLKPKLNQELDRLFEHEGIPPKDRRSWYQAARDLWNSAPEAVKREALANPEVKDLPAANKPGTEVIPGVKLVE